MDAQPVRMKVPFVFRRYSDIDNILPHVFHCNIRLDNAKLCNDEEYEFFCKFL